MYRDIPRYIATCIIYFCVIKTFCILIAKLTYEREVGNVLMK